MSFTLFLYPVFLTKSYFYQNQGTSAAVLIAYVSKYKSYQYPAWPIYLHIA